MQISRESELVSRYLPLSLAAITIFVSTNIGADPVNLPKLTLLVLSASLFIGIGFKSIIELLKYDRKTKLICLTFLIGLFISLLFGRSSFITNFFGAWARNTGALTYLSLLIVFLLIGASPSRRISANISLAIYIAGLINIVYGLSFIITGKDLINWSNRYGKFLSTLGNPDFASGFLGLVYAVGLYFVLDQKQKHAIRIAAGILSPVIILVILKTGALQGLILVALSSGLYLSIWFLTTCKSKRLKIGYVFAAIGGMALTILGMLQIGPLSSILYKPSVSIRGAYWRAAMAMFESSPIYGIGLDSYGDWYRRSRDAGALLIPGVDVTTDAAHNVFLDLLAGGGLLLTLPYLALIIYVTQRGIISIKRDPKDLLSQGLFVSWVCYLAQSAISINQIGLAIWGWALAGAVVSYSKISNEDLPQKKLMKKIKSKKILKESTFMVSIASITLGALLILPVQIAEAKWRNAVKTRNINKILTAADSWPKSCGRYMMTYNLFAGTSYTQQALSLIQKCRNLNKDDFQSLLLIEQFVTNDSDKLKLKREAHRLDPLNPKYK